MLKIFHSGYYVTPKSTVKTQERVVEYYEIELYNEHFGFTYLNGTKYCLKKNDVLIAVPGDVRCSEGCFSCHSFKFVCTDNDYKKMLDEMPKVFSTNVAVKLIPLFNELYKAFLLKHDFECDALIRQICATLYYPRTYNAKYAVYVDDINRIVEYVCENISQKLSLEELASLVNLSPSFFHKVFSSIIGTTVGEFIIVRRIEKAKELLLFRELSVDDVAFDCGFSSRAYFDKTFKKRVGVSPVEFRK